MKKSSVNPSSSSDLRYGPDILSLLGKIDEKFDKYVNSSNFMN